MHKHIPAVDPLLKFDKYVKKAIEAGHSKEEIRQAAIQKGWDKDIVDRELDKF